MKFILQFRKNIYGKYSEKGKKLEFDSKDWEGIEFDTNKGWRLVNENFGVPLKEDSSSLNEKVLRPFRNLGCPCQNDCCDSPNITGGEEKFETHCGNCNSSCFCNE